MKVTNESPSFHDEQERVDLLLRRSLLVQEKKRLAADLAARREEYQNLLRKEVTASRDMEDLGKIFDPVRALPNEILLRIFAITRDLEGERVDPSLPLFVRDSLRGPSKAPWNISQVSKRWNAVATGYPHLWSLIGLEFSRSPSSGILCLLSLQNMRAAEAGIHMSINISDSYILQTILPFCISTASHWKYLILNIQDFVALHIMSPLKLMLHNSLEMVHIRCRVYTAENSRSSLFKDLPHLREVAGHPYALSKLDLSWEKIEKVSLLPQDEVPRTSSGNWRSQMHQFLLVVLPASNVCELCVKGGPIMETLETIQPSGAAPTQWPALRTLILAQSQHRGFLRKIIAPQITSIQSSMGSTSWRDDVDEIIAFLKRSKVFLCRVNFTIQAHPDSDTFGGNVQRALEGCSEHIYELSFSFKVNDLSSSGGPSQVYVCEVDCIIDARK